MVYQFIIAYGLIPISLTNFISLLKVILETFIVIVFFVSSTF